MSSKNSIETGQKPNIEERLQSLMLGDNRLRAVTIIVLLIILLFLFIWYGSLSPAPEKGRFPGADELVEDYESYIGEEVEVSGKVIETDPVIMIVERGDRTIQLEIADLQQEPEQGDRLSVFGTAGENNTIYVQNAIIRPFWRYGYMYGISLVGAIWIGLRVIGQWRFDKKDIVFKVRKEPMSIKDMLSLLKRGDGSG